MRELRIINVTTCAALCVCLLAGCEPKEANALSSLPELGPTSSPDSALQHLPIPPIPRTVNEDPRKVALGRQLFHDRRLSRNNSIACSDCHNIAQGGADGRALAVGIDGQKGDLNSPTVLNSGFNFRQFWDGRAETLEEQVDGPLHNAKELDSSYEQVIGKLRSDVEFTKRFEKAYKNGLTADSIRDAIASFERSLITPDSPFDRYLRGDQEALSASALSGYELFVDIGCVSCHQGVNAGGNLFQRLGTMEDFFAERDPSKADLGRFNVTNDPADRHTFKVPSLRNVARTAPYFHDGSVATLEEAIAVMATYQLGYDLTPEETTQIAAFLTSLNGEIPE